MITLYKEINTSDGKQITECTANINQVSLMEGSGWSEIKPDTKKSETKKTETKKSDKLK